MYLISTRLSAEIQPMMSIDDEEAQGERIQSEFTRKSVGCQNYVVRQLGDVALVNSEVAYSILIE